MVQDNYRLNQDFQEESLWERMNKIPSPLTLLCQVSKGVFRSPLDKVGLISILLSAPKDSPGEFLFESGFYTAKNLCKTNLAKRKKPLKRGLKKYQRRDLNPHEQKLTRF